jgi:hypothetical protein
VAQAQGAAPGAVAPAVAGAPAAVGAPPAVAGRPGVPAAVPNAQAQVARPQAAAAGFPAGAPVPAVAAPPPPIKRPKMGLFGKKKVCPTCGQPQDKAWESCPFCMQAEAPAPPPGAGPAPPPAGQKTMCIVASPGGGPTVQLLGWLVPIKGPQRGELYTLKSQNVIGTDPMSDVVLTDPFMSSKHATIRAQGGTFMLEDMGSTNGTFVNDRRVRNHELVDSDIIKFGSTMLKFKCL